MALKELVKPLPVKHAQKNEHDNEATALAFIAQGGSLAGQQDMPHVIAQTTPHAGDHRFTLRIPKELMAKIDEKRKKRLVNVSRNLWILEQLEKACML